MPSPTFTLMQTYELPRFPVVHADLYRLEGPGELAELGFDDLPKDAVVLLEWPTGRRASCRPTASTSPSRSRRSSAPSTATCGSPATARSRARVERMAAIRRFLDATGYAEAERAAHPGRRLDAHL